MTKTQVFVKVVVLVHPWLKLQVDRLSPYGTGDKFKWQIQVEGKSLLEHICQLLIKQIISTLFTVIDVKYHDTNSTSYGKVHPTFVILKCIL